MTIVHAFGAGHGNVVERVQVQGTAGVSPGSAVFASVAEWDRDSGQTFIGSASMTVNNISPGAGFVDLWVAINWGSDLTFQICLLIP